MSIDQHISVIARINNQGIAKQGFGTIGILSYTGLFPERTRTYRRVADMITAGFPADGPEVAAANKILGQSPHAPTLKVLRGTRKPTQKYTLNIGAIRNNFKYQINVKGQGVTPTTVEYTSDANATDAEIAAGITAALNLVPGKNFTAVGAASPIQVTADAPGNYFTLEILDTSAISIAQTHVDPGIAADLAEILVADADWYYLETSFNSSAMVLAAAAWVETVDFKFYVAHLVDSDIENTAAPGADVAAQHKAFGYKRSLCAYHRKPDQHLGAALEGRVCPFNVGTWTAAYLTLTGVTADSFTAQQMTNLDAKKCSYYKVEADRSIFWEGKLGNADYGFMDVTVSLDFVIDLIQKRLFSVRVALANAGSKVGYTDEDIQGVLQPAGQGALDIAKSDKHKIVAPGTPGDPNDPQPTFTFPFVKDIEPGERAVRNLPDGAASFRLQGAVDTIIPIDLTVTF